MSWFVPACNFASCSSKRISCMVSLGRVPLPSSFASAFRFRQRWHSRTFSQLVIAPCHSCHRLAFPAQQRWSTRAQAQSQQANNKGCAGQDPTSGDSREGSDEKGDVAQDTELILKLDRRGSGWGEEIFPHVTWERREVNPPKRRRRRDNNPDPWEAVAAPPLREHRLTSGRFDQLDKGMCREEGSLERFLQDIGVPTNQIENVVIEAVAWRVTPGGRPLIDRRRRARVERNMQMVADYLELECRVSTAGVAKILARTPQILLCKPATYDRWDRRVVELAAFRQEHGHVNVPEDYPENPELAMWVKRQRLNHAQGNLNIERRSVLAAMGFSFGEIAQLTEEWEAFFDQLLEWRMWGEAQGSPLDWDIEAWGVNGGPKARRLAIWVQLQREFRCRSLHPPEAVRRLNAINFGWEHPQGDNYDWVARFGQLLYLQEEALQAMQTPPAPGIQAKPERTKAKGQKPMVVVKAQVGWRQPFYRGGGPMAGGHVEGNVPGSAIAANRMDAEPDGGQSKRSRRVPPVVFPETSGNQDPLPIELEPGVGFWLAKQRWLWRRGRLERERMLMLGYASIDMDSYGHVEWVQMANAVASVLYGAQCTTVVRELYSAEILGGQAKFKEHVDVMDLSPIRMQRWVLTQNALWKQKGLSPVRLRYLHVLGITWILADEVLRMATPEWKARLNEVAECGEDQLSGLVCDWLHHQRCLRRLCLLPEDRVRQLEALGIEWNLTLTERDRTWEQKFRELLEFRLQHGHCAVPPNWKLNPSLAAWLNKQQEKIKAGELPTARHIQLIAAGVKTN